MDIRIRNLVSEVTVDDLKKAFAEYGEVGAVAIVQDKDSPEGKLVGFVEMPLRDEGLSAIKAINGKDFRGSAAAVEETTVRQEKEMIG